MSNINLTRFDQDGIEILIDTETGESFASQNAIARMISTPTNAVSSHQVKSYGDTLIKNGQISEPKEAEIPTTKGLKTVKLYCEKSIRLFARKYNLDLLDALSEAGTRVYLHKLAGFNITSTAVEVKPKTALELAREQVKILEELERKDLIIESLEEDNEKLSETVDELFSYSSIIRVAKYNNVSEKNFDWRILKKTSTKMGIEIKKVPCPRYVTKNLYSHDVWRVAYPDVPLPETTTLRIYTNDKNIA